MPDIDRNTAAIITSALRLVFLLAIVCVTAYYNNKPGLRGRVTDVLFALIHSLVFAVSNELCVRAEWCLGGTNVYRVWGSVIWIHIVVGWFWYLRSDAKLLAPIAAVIEPSVGPQPVVDGEGGGPNELE